MSEKVTTLEASLSDEQAQQVKELLSSKRKITEVKAELARLLAPGTSDAQRPHITQCDNCNCATGYSTCTHYVLIDGRWVPTVVTLEACNILNRFIGCLVRLFGG